MNNFNSIDNKRIGNFIAELRKTKNMTQEELANKIPIGRQAVSKWERGITIPDASTLIILSEIFDVTINDILNGEVIMKNKKEKSDDVLLSLYNDRNKSKKKLKILLAIILVLTFSFLIYYFFMSYGKTKIYNISGSGEYETYVQGMFVETNENLYFVIEKIGYQSELNYKGMNLYYKDEKNLEHLIVGGSGESLSFLDYKGYMECFDIDDLDYILNNLYLKLYFNRHKTVEIKLNVELDYTNNKIIIKKRDNISEKEKRKRVGLIEKDTELGDKLIEVMEEDENGDYTYTYKNKDIEIHYTYMDDFEQDIVHMDIINKDSSINIRYSSFTERIHYHYYKNDKDTCNKLYLVGTSYVSEGNCEGIDVYDEFNKYLNLIVDYKIEVPDTYKGNYQD